ncbi:unnamed protein product [Paramecium sonneborni]|uniref:Uncharacterized protein n=1 Tax=Paramecium sonneborni TaxID=65129 RepID=A0A8S1RSE4_9CILI|nr:unnamed protein product [Paramecium sonneborni]
MVFSNKSNSALFLENLQIVLIKLKLILKRLERQIRLSQEIQTKILLGDRKLAIWQGQRSYHFANPCQCPFVYYQYNSDENLSNIEMTHPAVTFLKFILGGNGNKRQPGFSEQFKLVTFSTQSSAYVDKISIKKPKSINNNCIIIKSKDSEQRQQKDDLVLKDLVEMAINFHQNIPTEDGINELMDQILVHGITYSELILRIGNCQDGLDLVTYNVPTYSYEQCQCQSFQEYLTQEQNIQKILCFLWISKKDQTAFHDSTVNR